MHRNGDEKTTVFSSNRVFFCNGDWYFSARELREIGPFSSREQVYEALYLYLKDVVKTRVDVTEYDIPEQASKIVDFDELRNFDWSELFPHIKLQEADTYH